ncbi:hypothetical protein C8R45DRAFT_933373 [Mycena sanguinolenta]|nr:hypothetical protein C8R45DRAFT_933373 [Mycena sanguinolenta]
MRLTADPSSSSQGEQAPAVCGTPAYSIDGCGHRIVWRAGVRFPAGFLRFVGRTSYLIKAKMLNPTPVREKRNTAKAMRGIKRQSEREVSSTSRVRHTRRPSTVDPPRNLHGKRGVGFDSPLQRRAGGKELSTKSERQSSDPRQREAQASSPARDSDLTHPSSTPHARIRIRIRCKEKAPAVWYTHRLSTMNRAEDLRERAGRWEDVKERAARPGRRKGKELAIRETKTGYANAVSRKGKEGASSEKTKGNAKTEKETRRGFEERWRRTARGSDVHVKAKRRRDPEAKDLRGRRIYSIRSESATQALHSATSRRTDYFFAVFPFTPAAAFFFLPVPFFFFPYFTRFVGVGVVLVRRSRDGEGEDLRRARRALQLERQPEAERDREEEQDALPLRARAALLDLRLSAVFLRAALVVVVVPVTKDGVLLRRRRRERLFGVCAFHVMPFVPAAYRRHPAHISHKVYSTLATPDKFKRPIVLTATPVQALDPTRMRKIRRNAQALVQC